MPVIVFSRIRVKMVLIITMMSPLKGVDIDEMLHFGMYTEILLLNINFCLVI